MTDVVIACLSQKGGVGKSTIARLVARTYASAGWEVKIADFNTNQLTSSDWVGLRMSQGVEPQVRAEPSNSVKSFKRDSADLIVADGKPDSDQSSLEIARVSDLILIPTGPSRDDMVPQVKFANELVTKGIARDRILFVLNKITESQLAAEEAREFLRMSGHRVAATELGAKQTYQNAQNLGRALSECQHKPLADHADKLAAEIVDVLNELQKVAA